ncbi:MAG: dual specificity protein phosphatase family protein [Pseudomonadota bacterium]
MIGPRRIAARYGAGALALGLAGLIAPPASLILLWPAFAMALVAAAYGGLGPGVLGKRAGRLAWGRRLLLAPYLAGAHVSLRLQSRGHPPYVEVAPGVLLGRRLTAGEARRLAAPAVLDLTAELSESAPLRRREYRCLPTLDLTVPGPAELAEGARFIAERLPEGPVYVHCALGLGRSATVVAAYLLASGQAATAGEAVARVKAAQPRAKLEESQLEVFLTTLC